MRPAAALLVALVAAPALAQHESPDPVFDASAVDPGSEWHCYSHVTPMDTPQPALLCDVSRGARCFRSHGRCGSELTRLVAGRLLLACICTQRVRTAHCLSFENTQGTESWCAPTAQSCRAARRRLTGAARGRHGAQCTVRRISQCHAVGDVGVLPAEAPAAP